MIDYEEISNEELDDLVAKKIFKWDLINTSILPADDPNIEFMWHYVDNEHVDHPIINKNYFRPSTNLEHAFWVVAVMGDDGFLFEMQNFVPNSDAIVWDVLFTGKESSGVSGWEFTPARAICIAALKAL